MFTSTSKKNLWKPKRDLFFHLQQMIKFIHSVSLNFHLLYEHLLLFSAYTLHSLSGGICGVMDIIEGNGQGKPEFKLWTKLFTFHIPLGKV